MGPSSHRSGWSGKLVLYTFLASTFVFFVSIILQWLVYDDWLHTTGPLHFVGTAIATAITFVFVLRWLQAAQQREREMVRRFKMILEMNDKIRNALQAIECLTYLSRPEATDSVRQSVNDIDAVLRQVLANAGPHDRQQTLESASTSGNHSQKYA
ncbi:MAG TPA: hypothetical protein VFP59_10690 [Candidatus Angelobacter sp.]|nr:hypothetical protein [Candidatus Angelobacter sp.]